MNAHPTQWFGAYLDGELDNEHSQRIQQHLKSCKDCQAEIEQLSRLSQVLQCLPELAPGTSADHFTNLVLSKLPARQPLNRHVGWRLSWWLIPAILISGWAFIQALIFVSGLLLRFAPLQEITRMPLESQSLLQDLLPVFVLPGFYSWISTLSTGLPVSQMLHLFLLNILASSACAILLGSWIASWFAYHRHIQTENLENRLLA
jgi:hypothetical protein